ncbi:MAG: hypothetical protein QMC77_00465 [Methanocellales archaeon]|nr:hypothetical protein [Methanocellales archaeon]
MDEKYELNDLIRENVALTKDGDFEAYFFVDYSEEWASTQEGQRILAKLPNVDVCIRHTKFQPSGGWIPGKMSGSVFLYSQNGTLYSNWNADELVVLVVLSLLAKGLHEGEVLHKIYARENEKKRVYRYREVELFQKVVRLSHRPRKLFVLGSPLGLYQFYY